MKYIKGVFKTGILLVALALVLLTFSILLVYSNSDSNYFADPAFVQTKEEISSLLDAEYSQSCMNGAAFELVGKFDMAKQYRKDFGFCMDVLKIRYMQEKLKVYDKG